LALVISAADAAHKLLFSPFMADTEFHPPEAPVHVKEEEEVSSFKFLKTSNVGRSVASELLTGVSSTAEFLRGSMNRMAPILQEVEIFKTPKVKVKEVVKSPVVKEIVHSPVVKEVVHSSAVKQIVESPAIKSGEIFKVFKKKMHH
jgi:hypothetical protein